MIQCNNVQSQIASLVPLAIALVSTTIEDVGSVGYFLEDQIIDLLTNLKKKIKIDLWLSISFS